MKTRLSGAPQVQGGVCFSSSVKQRMCRPLTESRRRLDGHLIGRTQGKRSLSDYSGKAVWYVWSIKEAAAFLPTWHKIYLPREGSPQE
jgi:hypothetical protein